MKIELIKEINAQEFQNLVEIFDKYRIFYSQNSDQNSVKSFLKQRIENQDSKIFVAKINDKIAGFSQLYPSFSSVSMTKTYILNDLFIDENYRNQKIAQKLINEIKDFCKTNNIKKISLRTQKTNQEAKNLYEKIGFTKDEIFDDYYLNL